MNRKWLERGGPLVRLVRAAARGLRHRHDTAVLSLLNALVGKKRASALDVFFAYRLMLGRSPDDSGFAHHRRRLSQLQLTPEQLAADFWVSSELKARVAPAQGPLPAVEKWVQLDDFSILVDGNDLVIGEHLARHRTWEPDVTRAVRRLLREGDTFVDVGANIGYFTLLGARQVGPTGRVVAIEPAPHNFQLLQKSVARNGLHQIEAHQVAVGASTGRAQMALPDRANGGSYALVGQASTGTFEVQLRPLDDLIAGRRVDLVKIDVEGAEEQALAGMGQILKTSRPLLLLEYTGGRGLINTLGALGYGAQQVSRFEGRLVAQSFAELSRALEDWGDGHLDLLLFPLERTDPV